MSIPYDDSFNDTPKVLYLCFIKSTLLLCLFVILVTKYSMLKKSLRFGEFVGDGHIMGSPSVVVLKSSNSTFNSTI